MASTYPTTLDSFTNPIAANPLTAPSHAQQHSDINDAMEAVQTKLAIGNTLIGTYVSFTPSLNNITLGNGTLTTNYCTVNEFVHFYGKLVFGSTTSITTNGSIVLPLTPDTSSPVVATMMGVSSFTDVSTGNTFFGQPNVNGVGNAIFGGVAQASGTYTQSVGWTSTSPFTWAVGDYYSWNVVYKKA